WRLELDASALRTLRRIPERYAAAIVEHVTGLLLEVPRRLRGRRFEPATPSRPLRVDDRGTPPTGRVARARRGGTQRR
ncbi:hypothetical protein, partial [Aestuariivirga sp.]|uniref:hypothetical protein n=1 Tax=Aestuariivirga sp. TaxID=2650926 RepID=UPI0030166743